MDVEGATPSVTAERGVDPFEGSPLSSGAAPVPLIRRRRRRSAWATPIVVATFLTLLLLLGAVSGWFAVDSGAGAPGSCPRDVTLTGEGASLLLPLLSNWTATFQSRLGSSQSPVNFDPAGAGAGVTALIDRSVDFGATDEPLSASERSSLPGTLTLPVAGSSIAIVYDLPGVTAPLRLNASLLAGIYLGTILSWDDPSIAAANPGIALPSAAIVTVHRADAAGTTYVLSDYLSAGSRSWANGPGVGIQLSWPSPPTQRGEVGNTALARFVAATRDSVGYVDLADALRTSGLGVAQMGNPSGAFVAPSVASSRAALDEWLNTSRAPAPDADWSNVSLADLPGATVYPLAALAYLIVPADLSNGFAPSASKSQLLVTWLEFAVSAGQSANAGLDFVPLPSSFVADDERAIAAMTDGGTPLTGCDLG